MTKICTKRFAPKRINRDANGTYYLWPKDLKEAKEYLHPLNRKYLQEFPKDVQKELILEAMASKAKHKVYYKEHRDSEKTVLRCFEGRVPFNSVLTDLIEHKQTKEIHDFLDEK